MSIPILVVKMPQIIPFPVYGQTGNGIIMFWNWFWGHLDLRINFRFHVHTHFVSRSWDMIYLFIPLNTILFMAKFTMKTTTNSTTSIMLSLSLHPVITTKQVPRGAVMWKGTSSKICGLKGSTLVFMSIHILVVEMPQIVPFPVYGQTGNGIMTFWNWFCGHLELRINFGFHVHTHFGIWNA